MQKLLIILSFCCGWSLIASGQSTPLPRIPKSGSDPVSSYQQKLSNKKDSALSQAHKYFNTGKSMKGNNGDKHIGADTLPAGPRHSPKLAATGSAPDPVKMMPSLDRNACKSLIFIPAPQSFANVSLEKEPSPPRPVPVPAAHPPFLTVHGNVLYNLNYYSRIDTPFNEHDIYQHTIQTWLDIVVKGEYPFRIYLTNHFSNSSLFRNFSDLNFAYNNNKFSQQLKDQARKDFLRSLPSPRQLDSLQKLLNSDWQKLNSLSGWMKNPALVQKMVEAKELTIRRQMLRAEKGQLDSIARPRDSSAKSPGDFDPAGTDIDPASVDSVYKQRQREADSLKKEIVALQQKLQSARQKSSGEVNQTLEGIQRADNPEQLQQAMRSAGLSDSALPKGYKTLMAIKSFSLGRTLVNYSELSVKNIAVNGVQVEYNPSMYYAFAKGGVDYRFRDFLVQGPGNAHQNLTVLRAGKGMKNGNNVILTWFTGRRQLYNAVTTDSPRVQVPSSSLMGMTVEGNYRINDHILLTGEFGKSTMPAYTGDSTKRGGSSSQLFQLNNRSNEAWSLMANAHFPATGTRLKASYKHLGINYQSFSIFTDGSSQTAWGVQINQLLFRKQLDVLLGANTNDFSNPLISQQYKSTTVFKKVQLTWRRRNWPVISAGYFPSSQLTRLGNGGYIENLFYTLTGNVTHSYSYHHLLMNTAMVYTQFYNRASDSGFTYFNTRNLMVSQTLFLDWFTLQCNASAASNQDYQLYTLEGKVQHPFSSALTLGAGIKYNKQTVYQIEQLGYSAEATLRLNHLGQIQFSADKGFVPGMSKRLVPSNTGRLTYFKSF